MEMDLRKTSKRLITKIKIIIYITTRKEITKTIPNKQEITMIYVILTTKKNIWIAL